MLDEQKINVRRAQELMGYAAANFSRVRQAKLQRFTLDSRSRTCSVDKKWARARSPAIWNDAGGVGYLMANEERSAHPEMIATPWVTVVLP